MSPQLVDFTADGILDMVMGTFEGVAFLVPGTEEGYGQPEYIRDRNGETILLCAFWNRDTEKWDDTRRSFTDPKGKEDHCISVVAVDWDADGDLDLLLGAKEGRLYLQRNEGKGDAPAFSGKNELLRLGAEEFSVPGGLTAPRIVDWNADGLFDLLCASFEGGVFLYPNAGRKGAPLFEERVVLVPRQAQGDDLPDSPMAPSTGLYVDAVDYDGDGDLDLLVGGESTWHNPERELTEAEETRLQEATEARELIEAQMDEMRDRRPDKEDEAYAAWREKYSVLRGQSRALFREISPLTPGKKVGEFVWLYRRNE